MNNRKLRKGLVIGIVLAMVAVVFAALPINIGATLTYPVAPDSPMNPPPDAPSGVVYEDFEG